VLTVEEGQEAIPEWEIVRAVTLSVSMPYNEQILRAPEINEVRLFS
jgi:hypothetical protein